jgi:hypothetical protein
MKRFRVQRPSDTDARWLHAVLDRESRRLGGAAEFRPNNRIELRWQ